MYLKNLKLARVRDFEKAELDFSVPGDGQGGLNIIIGPNMSGKSTLFQVIHLALFGNAAWLGSGAVGGAFGVLCDGGGFESADGGVGAGGGE